MVALTALNTVPSSDTSVDDVRHGRLVATGEGNAWALLVNSPVVVIDERPPLPHLVPRTAR
jgi:hypothetical protein